ncbi:MAG: F0F1 ATP synthase subunit gamma [Actinobacteria bacterium]|nr:F0F1 ATP synthase subunit gamma [Actinomycetota bacterium]
MGAQLRVYRRRIKSVKATKKITKAMELIASSRIVKAQQRVQAATPYTRELTRAISAAASHGNVDHPLVRTQAKEVKRAAIVLVTADRGLAGAYSSNIIKEGEQLTALLKERGLEVEPFLVGRKAVGYYKFRERKIAGSWTGFTDQPMYSNAKEIAAALLEKFVAPVEQGGVQEIHIVYTHFANMVTQTPTVTRILPLQVQEVSAEDAKKSGSYFPLYEFEPSPEGVLDALLPRYIENLVYTSLLLAAASEHAARRRAMKSATDNAEEMIRALSRAANQARQAEITQEISEIVGGADALASANAGN